MYIKFCDKQNPPKAQDKCWGISPLTGMNKYAIDY